MRETRVGQANPILVACQHSAVYLGAEATTLATQDRFLVGKAILLPLRGTRTSRQVVVRLAPTCCLFAQSLLYLYELTARTGVNSRAYAEHRPLAEQQARDVRERHGGPEGRQQIQANWVRRPF